MVSVARFIDNNFSINLYFHFGWYSKRKKILELFYISRDKKYCKTIKCHSFWLFDLSEGLTGALRYAFCFFSRHCFPLPRSRNQKQ